MSLADAWDAGFDVGFACGYGDGHQPDKQANPYRQTTICDHGCTAITGVCIVDHKPAERGAPAEPAVTGPTSVTLSARRGGKTPALIERILAQANERGIRIEIIYPQQEVTDEMVERGLKVSREFPMKRGLDNARNVMRAVLEAALNIQEGA